MGLGAIAFLLIGFVIISVRHTDLMDVHSNYIASQCFLRSQCDPYNQQDLLRIYSGGNEDLAADSAWSSIVSHETRNVYLPTTSALTIPFALLPYPLAKFLWIAITAAAFVLACFAMWHAGSAYNPLLSAALLSLYLVNSGSLISTSNPGVLSLSLCVIAAWCFMQQRFVPAGIMYMAVSLGLKPHESGLIWLLFLLAGGIYRKRALQSLLVVALISLPTLLWITHTSPHWISELHANMLSHYAHGGVDDPGPAAALNRGALVITDLQAIISFFADDPSIYNPLSYAIGFAILATLAFASRKARLSSETLWIGLAAVSVLTMLPLYHRLYDAKILILTIPACAALWAVGGRLAKITLLVEGIGLFVTADLPWAFFRALVSHLQASTTGMSRTFVIVVLSFPVPLALLLMCCFYTAIFSKRSKIQAAEISPSRS
jgi:hypothetical protein